MQSVSPQFPKGYFQKSDSWLDNYQLTPKQVLTSFVFSEYATRHLSEAKVSGKVSHYVIAVIEFIPVLGGLASLVEGITSKIFKKSHSNGNSFAEYQLPHDDVPATNTALQAIQKSLDERQIPLHVSPLRPKSHPLQSDKIEEFRTVLCRPDYKAYNGDNKEVDKELVERALSHVQYISMEMMEDTLQRCVGELNQKLAEENNPSYTIGLVCGKSFQWVASLALPHLSYLPEDWCSIPINDSETSFVRAPKSHHTVKSQTLVLFDDCAYSGRQLTNTLMSLSQSKNIKRIFVVVPFMSNLAIDRIKNFPKVHFITSDIRIKTLAETFTTNEELQAFSQLYVKHTPLNRCVFSLQGGAIRSDETLCYTDWRPLPDSVSYVKDLGEGITEITEDNRAILVGKFNYDKGTRPYEIQGTTRFGKFEKPNA